MEINKVYKGHALNIVESWPDELVDCIVTSPPYWNLRDYKTEPLVWDGDPECDHDWNAVLNKPERGTTADSSWDRASRKTNPTNEPRKSEFCNKCGAWKGQLGLEPDFNLYIKHLCDIFDEMKRILNPHGTVWVNIGDTYYGSGSPDSASILSGKQANLASGGSWPTKRTWSNDLQAKCLTLIPSRFAIEMENRGWILRNSIVWQKDNAIPESVKDRFTSSYEFIFFFSKKPRYYFKQQLEMCKPQSIRQEGWGPVGGKKYADMPKFSGEDAVVRHYRNRRDVWSYNTAQYPGAHTAVFPVDLIRGPIDAGCPKKVCTKCGQPVEVVYDTKSVGRKSWTMRKMKDRDDARKMQSRTRVGDTKLIEKEMITCECDGEDRFRKGIVLDPFIGTGTTAVVAHLYNVHWLGIDLNPDFVDETKKRAGVSLREFIETNKR